MKTIFKKLYDFQTLTKNEAYEALLKITNNELNEAQLASFLTVYMMRSITVDELMGFREALLSLAIKVDFSDYETIDLCGTGGDHKNTFNISTLTALVVAGTGTKVAKHGSYGVSSTCGSSNVLEQLGYKFTSEEQVLRKQLEDAHICFLHAPLFHPAMKSVAPVRKALGLKTFFNMLGPLVNPSSPKNQMAGVYNMEIARIYAHLLQQTPVKYSVVYALDGYDEISLTGKFRIINSKGSRDYTLEELNLERIKPEAIYGGTTVKEAADLFVTILKGEGTQAQNRVVLTNAAFAIKTMHPQYSFEEAFEEVSKSLYNKDALASLKKITS